VAAGWLYSVQEVKPNVFVWVSDDVLDLDGDPQFPRAGTAGFIVTSEGVVVVNTTDSPFHARELLYEVRHRSELPVRYAIDTSASGEQMLGNEVFTDLQAILIASARTQEQILHYRQLLPGRLANEQDKWKLQDRMRGFHVTPPTETFTSEMALRLGGQEIRLRTLLKNGPGDDAVVYLPAAKVLFLGELFQNGYFPHIGSRNLRDWAGVLRQVEKWDVDVYVPGHGAPGGKKEVAEFRQFLEWFGKEVETRFQGGESISQVKREVGPLLDNYKWHAPELFSEELDAIYKQTVGTPASQVGASQTSARVPLGVPTAAH
jgi:glyoxylase-like metal-dependent hydrolase (beta-lactamase superfamily II)